MPIPGIGIKARTPMINPRRTGAFDSEKGEKSRRAPLEDTEQAVDDQNDAGDRGGFVHEEHILLVGQR